MPIGARADEEKNSPEKGAAVDVSRFGVVPDDGEDDTKGVLAALEECRKYEAPRLVFQPGRYHFHEGAIPAHPNVCFPVRQINNLTIEGNGAELIFHGKTSSFVFSQCNNLTIRNLVVDWDRPSYSTGEILSSTDAWFDVKVFEDYPVSGGEPVQSILEYDPRTRIICPDSADVYYPETTTELIAKQTLRVHTKSPIRLKPGRWALLRHQIYGFNVFVFAECQNVTLSNTTIYTCPGMGVVGDNSRDMKIERLKVIIRPGSNRLMSTTADATHFSRCQGTVELRDCVFEGMGDDAGNFKGLYLTTLEQKGDRTVLAQHNLKHYHPPFPGDTMEFVRRETLLPYATGIVKSVTPDAGEGRHGITFEKPLPAEFKLGDVLANATRIPRVRIKGCIVRNNRARGFLIQSRDAIVEDCTFDHCTAGGIFVMTEVVYFYESLGTRDIIVRNNKFLDCAYATVAGCECPVTVFGYLADFKFPPQPGVHRDITIENNEIRGSRNSGIFVAATDGLTVQNNTIEGVCQAPTREQYHNGIYIMSTANAKISGNNIDPVKQGREFKEVYELGPGCVDSAIQYKEK